MTQPRKPTNGDAFKAPTNATTQTAVVHDLEPVDQGPARFDPTDSTAQLAFSQRIGARIGRRQVARAVEKLVTVADILELQEIKSSKAYRGLQLLIDEKLVTITRWEDYCLHAEGRSREQVDEDLRNIKAFGPAFLEEAQKLGVGYRQLRDMRQVPVDQRAQLIEAAKSGDKDALLDLIDQHSRETETLEKEITDREVTLGAKDRTIAKTYARIRELEEANHLRDSTSVGEQMELLRQDTQAAVNAIACLMGTVDRLLEQGASPAIKLCATQAAEFLAQHLAETLLARNITVNFDEELTPIFLEETNAIVGQGIAAEAARAAAKPAKKR